MLAGIFLFYLGFTEPQPMKKFLLAPLCLITFCAGAQITINSSHLPNAGDILYRRNATLLSEVDLEATGENYTWNFGDDVIELGPLDNGTTCNDLSDISLFNQIYFNNPFNPSYNSDFGLGFTLVDLGFITIEDAFQVYKNSGNVYAITGVAATVGEIPISSIFDERDIIYNLPLTYPASGSSHSVLELTIPTIGNFTTDQTRTYECDGWGVLNIAGQSFDVLRVKSLLVGSDALFGFEIPKDITTYQWLSTDFNVPVLEITSTDVLGQAQITASTADIGVGVEEEFRNELTIFPNPVKNVLNFNQVCTKDSYSILSATGSLVEQGQCLRNTIDVKHLPPGLYFMQIEHDNKVQQVRFVKE
jgi:hypothetical protein